MLLSVIIIGYNSLDYLKKNLASLSFLKDTPDSEIFYVDNASTDGTIAYIENVYPFVKIIRNAENKGIAKARNQGLREARGEYIWILDSDTEVTKEALDSMLTYMNSHPDVGICGCRLLGQDGTTQFSCRKYPTVREKLKAAIHIIGNKIGLDIYSDVSRRNSYDLEQHDAFDVDYLIGACQLIRREVLQLVGFLDENIFYGPEDADFCYRTHQVGYRVCYLPMIHIYHAYQRVSSYKIFNKITYKHITGLIYYFWKCRSEKKKAITM
ncbi:glycosyltransferase family 2 protein [Bacteroidales bacterium OttesenSCG-928-M11]|nr:glycosyltransferase family 2 protein [Bacteroidales bacterium OttesenSCG-928-M11]